MDKDITVIVKVTTNKQSATESAIEMAEWLGEAHEASYKWPSWVIEFFNDGYSATNRIGVMSSDYHSVTRYSLDVIYASDDE